MATQQILPIDISQGIDQQAAECVGAPRVGDAVNVRLCGPGDVRVGPGYLVADIATADSVASPVPGHLLAACSTDGVGTLGLVHLNDDLFLAQLKAGATRPLYWNRVTQYEASANVPQLGGICSRVLGAPTTVVGGAEQSLAHSVQVHAHSTLGAICVVNSTDGVVGSTVNRPMAAELRVLQKGVVVSSLPLTYSGYPNAYGVAPIIRDGYLACMFGTYTLGGPYLWSGYLVVWRLEDMTSATSLPTPVWAHPVSVSGLVAQYGTGSPVMALSPDGTRLAVAIPSYGLLVRRLDVPGTSGPTATSPANMPSVDIIWSTDSTVVWVACQAFTAEGVLVGRYSATATLLEALTFTAPSGFGATYAPYAPFTWVRALGYVHLMYCGLATITGASDGSMNAMTFLDTQTVAAGYLELGPLDFGRPASRPLMVSTDRGYMLSVTYSQGASVLRTTYALELRFSTTAPRIVAEIAGSALEGQSPHNVQTQGWGTDLRTYSQLSSLAVGTTELHEPQIAHVLEGVMLPRYLLAGAVLSPDPFPAAAAVDVDRNPRVGILLAWELLTSDMQTHMFLRGALSRPVCGGAMISHGAPLWITPAGRGLPGFPDAIPTFWASTGGGGTIPAGSYQLCFIAEHTDALGLVHRSPPSYPVTLAPGSSNQTFTLLSPRGIPVYGRTDVGGGVASIGYSLALYMTQAGGSLFYLVRQGVVPSTTITVTAVPSATSRVLYTQTGQVARYSPPQMSCLAIGKERALAGGFWRDTEVRFSLLMVPGEGLAWPAATLPQWRLQLPSAVRSVAAIGDSWAVFCASGIYVITGDGPDDSGAGGSFSTPSRVSLLSLGSCKSVVEADEGVYFQAADGHMYLMQSGSGQCQRITEKIRDQWGVGRLDGGPTWQTVVGAGLEDSTGDLLIAQWGYDLDVVGTVAQQTIWRYSRARGTWSRDVAPMSTYDDGTETYRAHPCTGMWELRLPGNGYTTLLGTDGQQMAVEATGSLSPSSTPTARIETTWMSPFGAHAEGQLSGVSVLSGFPRRSANWPWGSAGNCDVVVTCKRDYSGATQVATLDAHAGAHPSPCWRTAELDLAEQSGRQIQVVLEWTDQSLSVASLALQGAPAARFERVSDARSG